MDNNVQVLTRLDVLRALRNSYLEQQITSEINIKFFNYKSKNLTNGQNIKAVKENLINSERNLDTMNAKLKIVDELLETEPRNK
jgi:hypothetical protein